MKKSILIIGAIIMMAGFSTRAMAQSGTPSSASNTAGAILIVPLKLLTTHALNFGTLNMGTGLAGTCTLATDGTTSYTDGVTNSQFKSAPANATYTVAGTYNMTYALTVDPSILLNAASGLTGAKTMTINNLMVSFTNNPGPFAVATSHSTLSPLGVDAFIIGGTLNVGAAQASGAYTGSFNASVEYN